jgi:hypothetical protein
LATQLMKELGLAEENMAQVRAIQPELVELASSNLRVSRLVWTDLFPVARENSDATEVVPMDTAG